MVKEFIARGLTNNDFNNILLEGLAEGSFFQECLRLYHLICKEKKQSPSLCLYPHGYHAVIKSACGLKQFQLANQLYLEMKKNQIMILEPTYFEMVNVFL